jgi:hypothetical protein
MSGSNVPDNNNGVQRIIKLIMQYGGGSGIIDGDRLPAMSVTKKGAVPATGTPSGLFLKDDGTWAAVSTTNNTNAEARAWGGF